MDIECFTTCCSTDPRHALVLCTRHIKVVLWINPDFLSSVVPQRPQLERIGCRFSGPNWANGAKRGRGATEYAKTAKKYEQSPAQLQHLLGKLCAWRTQCHRSYSGYLCCFLCWLKITSLGRILEPNNVRPGRELRNHLVSLLHSLNNETQG